MARKVVNNSLPNFFIIDSPLELRELMRKSASLVFLPRLALQRQMIEDQFKRNGYSVHQVEKVLKDMDYGDAHPGMVLTTYSENCTGYRFNVAEIQHAIFWGLLPFEFYMQGRARIHSNDISSLIKCDPPPGYIYLGPGAA